MTQHVDDAVRKRVREIIKRSASTRANLALLPDKELLFSASGNAFIMYRIKGKSWVALGDPIGPEDEHRELILRFKEMAIKQSRWPVFYLVDPDELSTYVDAGLSVIKLGDEARIPLKEFSFSGEMRTEMRKMHERVLQEGVSFEVLNSSQVKPLIGEFKTVSDAWLAATKIRERSFSKAYFDADYIANFPCAIMRKDAKIVAFAVLWASANREELALDLMRYHPDAPKDAMDFLLLELMLGGRVRGYRWFNLGIAPLASGERHPLEPLWQRIGGLIYRHSEHFHDIQSLRRYEERFNPLWRAKYLASPGGLSTPWILLAIVKMNWRGRV